MRRFLKLLVSSCALLLTAALPLAASAKPFSELIIFSGSLSDVGNYASVHGDFPPPFFHNRTTNGPNLEDFLAENLLFENKPSLHLIGPPVGNNFAVFQSLAGGNGPEDLPAQLDAYLNARGGVADPNALFYIFISGTEVINAVATPDDDAASQILNASVAGIETAMRRLVRAGAKTLLVPNFTDLGTTPFARKLNQVERATRISLEFERKFQAMLKRVDCDLDFELIRWDFLQWSRDFLDHADQLGFTNKTDSCLDVIGEGKCDFDRFVFFNDFFLTSRVHRLIGNAVTQAIYQREDDDRRHNRSCRRHRHN